MKIEMAQLKMNKEHLKQPVPNNKIANENTIITVEHNKKNNNIIDNNNCAITPSMINTFEFEGIHEEELFDNGFIFIQHAIHDGEHNKFSHVFKHAQITIEIQIINWQIQQESQAIYAIEKEKPNPEPPPDLQLQQ